MENSYPILETERLLLRRQQEVDIAALTDLWSDPQVTLFLGGPRDREWLKETFAETARDPLAEKYDLWPVIEKATGKVIGHCGLLDKEVEGKTEIELNYILAPPVWGKGFATEIGQAIIDYAFGKLESKRLIALIEPENEPSKRVALRLGMHLEGEIIRPGGALRELYAIEAQPTRL